ncbi:SWIM zinc finger family protein [Actinomadura parmotrematis]|uniref:SWIM zinc finger domain-containing protein n=1 Tax=Actinomadura parmotrematis TaxID=2864039 RepID=A0ABS7FQ12_9ACTN|nr:SWIM zinc finger family protein [Actinomadura parmotrematis]MBW8482504.1 SWIM zinc finger domain-containing protein [Actinomadura parmotrematis]
MATTAGPAQGYSYARPSGLAGGVLDLATSGGTTLAGPQAHPHFFSGVLTRPAPAAAALLGLADVARTRYFQPRPTGFRDPVVTCNGDRLRLESFSACGGVYARLDVLQAGMDGEVRERGTTNVDVNGPLREALARVGGGDPLHFAVGAEELVVTTGDGAVVEKKVPLPDRWLRGFAEVQVITAGFDPRAELAAADAVRFLRALPARTRGPMWAVPAGRTLRLGSRPVPGAVCLPGAERLRTMLPLLRFATGLRAYGPPATAASGPLSSVWELELPGMRYVLALSPETDRGFSGEGAVLDALAGDEVAADADLLGALLAFEPRVEPDLLAERSGLDLARTRAALTQLGTSGRVGFDAAEAAFFHRELPYDPSRVAALNPRLRAARELMGAVRFTAPDVALVPGSDQDRQVRFTGDAARCTCPWWAKYRGDRGPCKHVLAARLVRDGAAVPAGGAR